MGWCENSSGGPGGVCCCVSRTIRAPSVANLLPTKVSQARDGAEVASARFCSAAGAAKSSRTVVWSQLQLKQASQRSRFCSCRVYIIAGCQCVSQLSRAHFGWTSLTDRDMVDRILIRNWPRLSNNLTVKAAKQRALWLDIAH